MRYLILVGAGWLLAFPTLPARADSFTLTLTPDAPEYVEEEKANVTIAVAAASGARLLPRTLELIVRFGLKDDPSPPVLARFLPLPASSVTVETQALTVGTHRLRAELFSRGSQDSIERKTRQIQRLEADIVRLEARLAQTQNPRQQAVLRERIARKHRLIAQLQTEIAGLNIPLASAKSIIQVEPLLEITFPQDGETFENALKLSLRGKLGSLEFGKPAVSVNGTALPAEKVQIDSETREFLASGIPVNNGANVIEAQLASVHKTITVSNKDTLPPFFSLHVDPPASIQTGVLFISAAGDSLRLHIRSEEAADAQVIVNGIPAAVTRESDGFVGEIQNIVPGSNNNARIEVRDAAGNLAAETVEIATGSPEEPKPEERRARFAQLIFEELDGTPIDLERRHLVNEVQFGEHWVKDGAITTEPEIRIRGIFQSAIHEVRPGEFELVESSLDVELQHHTVFEGSVFEIDSTCASRDARGRCISVLPEVPFEFTVVLNPGWNLFGFVPEPAGDFPHSGVVIFLGRTDIVGPDGTKQHDLFLSQPKSKLAVFSHLEGTSFAGNTLRVSGEIEDPLADITPAGKADITEVKVNGVVVPVRKVTLTPDPPLKPFRFKGVFEREVPLNPGINEIIIEAHNVLDEVTRARIKVRYDPAGQSEVLEVRTDPLTNEVFPFFLQYEYEKGAEAQQLGACVGPISFIDIQPELICSSVPVPIWWMREIRTVLEPTEEAALVRSGPLLFVAPLAEYINLNLDPDIPVIFDSQEFATRPPREQILDIRGRGIWISWISSVSRSIAMVSTPPTPTNGWKFTAGYDEFFSEERFRLRQGEPSLPAQFGWPGRITVETENNRVLHEVKIRFAFPAGFELPSAADRDFLVVSSGVQPLPQLGPQTQILVAGPEAAWVTIQKEDDARLTRTFEVRSVDLDVDTDRDGVFESESDEADEEQWSQDRGAFFMVNYDDDNGDGRPDAIDFDDRGHPTGENQEIENADDAKDITPLIINLRSVGERNEVAKVLLRVKDEDHIRAVHLFNEISPGPNRMVWGGPSEGRKEIDITAEVAIGSETTFGIEGLFFRSTEPGAYDGTFQNGYDGLLNLELVVVTAAGGEITDTVELKVAPFIMLPHTQEALELWTRKFNLPDDPTTPHEDESFHNGDFLTALAGSGLLQTYDTGGDQWTQDHVEIGYTQTPGRPPMHIVLRLPRTKTIEVDEISINVDDTPSWPVEKLLKENIGTFRFRNTILYDGADSGDFGGNIELMPPTPQWPLGRIIVGDTLTDKLFRFFQDQEQQWPFKVDTQWLRVGHVDEVIGFLPAGSGWSVIVADPVLASSTIALLPDDAVFFAVSTTSMGENLQASGGAADRIDDAGTDFTRPEWAFAKYLRIYEGTGAGQVAEIDTLSNGSLTVKNVWQTPTTVALGPGGPGSAAGTDCVWLCIQRPSIPPQAQWFQPPDATSKYLLVDNTRFWLDEVNRPVPAIMSVREVKNDTALWDLNTKAQERIEAVKRALETAAGTPLTFIAVPDIFMGEFGGNDIVNRTGIAFVPSLANFQPVGSNLFFAKGYGPTDFGGKDVFEEKIRTQVPGNAEVFVEDWNLYHRRMGQVHCATNVKRKVYDFNWWEK